MSFDKNMQERMDALNDTIQMNRLLQHARWLVLFGHMRRNWPKPPNNA